MSLRTKLLEMAKQEPLRSVPLAKKFGISRQTMTSHLHRLVEEGELVRLGTTRNATYEIPKKGAQKPTTTLHLVKKLKGLEEHVVLNEINSRLSLSSRVNKNTFAIVSYAFTEMLNNAIDHSLGSRAEIQVSLSPSRFHFCIRDYGIGVFQNVQRKFKLPDEFTALEHVLKGKQTTAPKAHSGEGIFFTSRIGDYFGLRSHRLKLSVDNDVKDSFVREDRPLKGTEVRFSIRIRSKKTLQGLFQAYSTEQFEFDKNIIRVQISAQGGALSRSQARRLVMGLEKYKRIVLDFKNVVEIGQGFADEVFRVYAEKASHQAVDFINANRAVEFMIRRTKRPTGR